MHALLAQCAALVRGLRSGCDRLCFGGTLRHRAHGRGRPHYLGAHRIPSQDCAAHRREVTARREEADAGSQCSLSTPVLIPRKREASCLRSTFARIGATHSPFGCPSGSGEHGLARDKRGASPAYGQASGYAHVQRQRHVVENLARTGFIKT